MTPALSCEGVRVFERLQSGRCCILVHILTLYLLFCSLTMEMETRLIGAFQTLPLRLGHVEIVDKSNLGVSRQIKATFHSGLGSVDDRSPQSQKLCRFRWNLKTTTKTKKCRSNKDEETIYDWVRPVEGNSQEFFTKFPVIFQFHKENTI